MNVSFSSQRRATECAASVALAKVSSTSAASKKGTENHKHIQLAIETGNYENLSPKLRAFLEECTEIESEVAYAIDIRARKVRRIGKALDRDYGALSENEIPGTVDLVCRHKGVAHAIDFKSRTRVEEAETNPQIVASAVAVCSEKGESEGVGGLWYLDNDYFEPAEFTALDMAAYFAERTAMQTNIITVEALVRRGEEPKVHTGSWCEYCAALHHCPAKVRLALAAIGELTEIQGQIASMTPEQAGRAWEKVSEIEKILEPVSEALKQRAIAEGSLPIEGGKRLLIYKEEKQSGFDFEAIKAAFAEAGQDVPKKVGTKWMPRKYKAA